MKILVPGANGQVGQSIRQLADGYPDWDFYFANSAELDITDRKAVDSFFKDHSVDWVINCAAYTAVDKAESEPELAQAVNATGVRHLASACAKSGAHLIHLSTDYVYHTKQNTPLIESDPVRPRNVYALTKLAGERAAQRALPDSMIIRTSWVYAAHGHNFVRTMLRLGREREQLNVVFDQIGTPTYAPDLAEAILNIIHRVNKGEIPPSAIAGVWHYANEGVTSWYDFAKAIFELSGIACKVNPIESKEYPTPAARPPFSVLNKAKIKEHFGIEIPHWRDSLRLCIALLD